MATLPKWWFTWWHKGEALRRLQDHDRDWLPIHLNNWDTLHDAIGVGWTCKDRGECMWSKDREHSRLRAVLWHVDQLQGVDLDRVAHFEGRKPDSMRRQVFRLRQGLVVAQNQLAMLEEAVTGA